MMQVAITIEINGHRHEVHRMRLTGAEIKTIGHDELGSLYRVCGDEVQVIADDEVVDLHEGERFRIDRKPLFIFIEDHKYEAPRRIMTGSEIKTLGSQPPANELYRLHNGERVLIEDSEKVHLHDGEVFITLPPCGHAS